MTNKELLEHVWKDIYNSVAMTGKTMEALRHVFTVYLQKLQEEEKKGEQVEESVETA